MAKKSSKSVCMTLPTAIPAGAVVCINGLKTKCVDGKKKTQKHAELQLKRPAGTFDRYIVRLLKTINPELSISPKTVAVLDAMLTDVGKRICCESASVAKYNKRKTVTLNDAAAGVGLVLRGELGKKAQTEGINANLMYDRFNKGVSSSTSERCNLQLPVPRVQTMLKSHADLRVGLPSAILITAALEYVATEILECANRAMTVADKLRLPPRYIRAVVDADRELSTVFAGASYITG